MRIWTIQSQEVYENILRKGEVYTCNDQHPHVFANEDENIQIAYDWIAGKLNYYNHAPKGVRYPVWGFHTYEWKNKKPDLRQGAFRKWSDHPCCCIEIEKDDNDVILSDLTLWHNVLNHSYVDLATNEEEFDQIYKWLDSLTPEEKEKCIVDSWDRILEPTIKIDTKWRAIGQDVQAVFWDIKPEDIRNVWYMKQYKKR